MTRLFPELITDILCRLPVKSLLRFRCVSKSWCYQIDDPYFIKLQLNQSLKTNTNLNFIIENNEDLFSVDLDTLDTAIMLNNPIEDGRYNFVLGSCNGLVALFNGGHLVLWNLSTREYHILPPTLELPGDSTDHMAYGFGYDSVSDDYKLVRIVVGKKESQVTVYRLKSNSWGQTRDIPSCYLRCHPEYKGILANNTLHWKVIDHREWVDWHHANQIVAFDLRMEEFFEVPHPDYLEKKFHMHIDSLGGCFCVVCNYAGVRVDIWVMKEYGVKESWTKHISVAMHAVRWPYGFVKLLAFSKSGDKVLLDKNDEEFFWYDLKSQRAEKVRIQFRNPYLLNSSKVQICIESLVKLNAGQEAKREIRKTGNPKKRMLFSQ